MAAKKKSKHGTSKLTSDHGTRNHALLRPTSAGAERLSIRLPEE
jgi:hypothetical protein